MTMMRLILLLVLLIHANFTFAERYILEQIDNAEVNAINNLGTIAGVGSDTLPFVWTRDENTNSYLAENRILLPTIIEIDSNNFRTIPTDNLHITDINNELGNGTGGYIVGWFVENGIKQSLLWYLYADSNRQDYSYKLRILEPHQLTARYCTNNAESDFSVPECMGPKDSELIYRASRCAVNATWDPATEGAIFVGEKDINNPTDYNCNIPVPLPLCEFKNAKISIGTRRLQSENLPVEIEVFEYPNNADYEAQKCITREHARLVPQVIACNDLQQAIWKAGEPLIIQCDKGSNAIAINNEDMIIGNSVKQDGSERPIFWVKTEGKEDNGAPKFKTGDLGTTRNKVSSGTAIDWTINLPSGPTPKTGITNATYEITYREGYALAIDKDQGSAAGMVKVNATDTNFTPVLWTGITSNSFELPETLLKPDPKVSLNDACLADPTRLGGFSDLVQITSLGSGLVTGWYIDGTGDSQPLIWLPCPTKVNDVVKENMLPGHMPTFNLSNIGKIEGINRNQQMVGSAKRSVSTAEGQIISEDHAFFRTRTCGIQDLNDLLVNPFPNRDIILESANYIASGAAPYAILATGRISATNELRNYILTPQDVYVDLAISVTSDHTTLTVGDTHNILVNIYNKGKPDELTPANYATCIFFTLDSAVHIDGQNDDENQHELIGGLTFESYEAVSNVSCQITRVQIICAVERLDPNQTISVKVKTSPRPLLADRTIRNRARIFATEKEKKETEGDNTSYEIIKVDREGCFIATAAYGSFLAPEVKMLREFRDSVLAKHLWGNWLIETYYRYSPPIANYISEHESARLLSRIMLTPVIYGVKHPILLSVIFLSLIVFAYTYLPSMRRQWLRTKHRKQT